MNRNVLVLVLVAAVLVAAASTVALFVQVMRALGRALSIFL